MKVRVRGDEHYPLWHMAEDGVLVDVDQETLTRWRAANEQFWRVQAEMHDLVDPPCPECGHRTSRHQEWSAGWDYWGCLDWHVDPDNGMRVKGCRCQYGKPEGR